MIRASDKSPFEDAGVKPTRSEPERTVRHSDGGRIPEVPEDPKKKDGSNRERVVRQG